MDSRRPEFTGRVQRDKIQRLYESDAKGMLDEELVDDIGISLLTRIESIFRAGKAIFGEAWCPHCGRPIQHQHRSDQVLRCGPCSWELTWGEFHKAIKGKHLAALGTQPFLEEFAREYPKARTAREKMIHIDSLLHRFHWELEQANASPAARDLIGGKSSEILEFLDSLAYGNHSTPETLRTHREWQQKKEQALSRAQTLAEQREAGRNTKADKRRQREERKKLVSKAMAAPEPSGDTPSA